jgi:hypothetical protein
VESHDAFQSVADHARNRGLPYLRVGDDALGTPFLESVRDEVLGMSPMYLHIPVVPVRGVAQHAAEKISGGLLSEIHLYEDSLSLRYAFHVAASIAQMVTSSRIDIK